MTRPRFLLLTDHGGHSDQNSLYALARTLAADPRTGGVRIASRGTPANAAFFAGKLSAPLRCRAGDGAFAYDPSGASWRDPPHNARLAGADVVWLRLPPPPDPEFFGRLANFAPATAQKPPVFVNDPRGILTTGSKAFLTHFPEFTAPVRRVRGADDVRDMHRDYPLVLKPLRDYGGRGLVRIMEGVVEADGHRLPLESWLAAAEGTLRAGDYLAMKYLRKVTEGDKRILVVNGRILGASLRLPAPGEWLCNVARGGTSVPATVTDAEAAMIAAVSPVLLRAGVVIYGADTLTDDNGERVLSELNTNSIGGFPQAEAQSGRPVLQQTIDGLYDYLSGRL